MKFKNLESGEAFKFNKDFVCPVFDICINKNTLYFLSDEGLVEISGKSAGEVHGYEKIQHLGGLEGRIWVMASNLNELLEG